MKAIQQNKYPSHVKIIEAADKNRGLEELKDDRMSFENPKPFYYIADAFKEYFLQSSFLVSRRCSTLFKILKILNCGYLL